jgi:hypothetical protein
MKKPETKLKEVVLKDLKTLDKAYGEKIQQVCKIGTLDIALTINSFAVWLELKKDEDEELGSLQKVKAYRHAKAGAYVFSVYPGNWKQVFAKLKKLNNFKHLSKPKI